MDYRKIKRLYPSCIFDIDDGQKSIYLTFDDGPTRITPWVLDQLKLYNAHATFFCIGENVKNHPEIFKTIIEEGHTIGNHSYSHPDGWITRTKKYIEDITFCDTIFKSKIFRPPYGRIRPRQLNQLKKNYRVIFWSFIPGDWKKNLDCDKTIKKLIGSAFPGSIIVLHDNHLAEKNIRIILPKLLEYFSREGYIFKSIPSD